MAVLILYHRPHSSYSFRKFFKMFTRNNIDIDKVVLNGMTMDDLLAELNADDECESIPFDQESIVNDLEINVDCIVDEDDTMVAEYSDTDSESNLPLNIIKNRILATNMEALSSKDRKVVWSKNDSPPENLLQFQDSYGPPDFIQELEEKTPHTLFHLFFTDRVIESLVFQTNLFAQQEGKQYKPTNVDEMKTFIGINLMMGIKTVPSYRDYWSTNKYLHDPFISSLMPVKRFSWLLSHLHVNDNSLLPSRGDPSFDKLYKIRPLISELQNNFSQCFFHLNMWQLMSL